jgi:hypothetical protein
MPIWSPAFFGSGAGSSGFVVEDSIWLDGGADYLVRDPSSAGNRKTFTFSCWLKRSAIGSQGGTTGNNIFGGDRASGSGHSDRIMFGSADDGNDWLETSYHDGSSGLVKTNALYRDTAWMHIVWVVDTTQSTDTNRVKVYVNGSLVTFNSPSYPAQDYDTAINNTENQAIGVRAGTLTQQHFGGYMAEIILLDGTAVSDASSFGELDSNGVWVPVNPSGLDFSGTNSFHLDFKVAPGTGNGAGTDVSGNGNHFTETSITAAQQVTDTCTDDADNNIGNYWTLNPLQSNNTLTGGNLAFTGASNYSNYSTAPALPMTGKWYWEIKAVGSAPITSSANWDTYVGVLRTDVAIPSGSQNSNANLWVWGNMAKDGSGANGQKHNNSSVSFVPAVNFGNNSIMMIAVDMDNSKIYFGNDGTWAGSADPAAGSNPAFTSSDSSFGSHQVMPYQNLYADSATYNFGATAFAHTPPTGFKALNTANLPAPTVTDPSKYFQTVIYTGDTNNNRNITGFQDAAGNNITPDLVWIKGRSNATSHYLQDAVREFGGSKELMTDANSVEGSQATGNGYIGGVVPGGFTAVDGGTNDVYVNENGRTYVTWMWKAGDSNTSVSESGSGSGAVNACTHRANTTSGFSIIKYTGFNDTISNGEHTLITHGLGSPPVIMIGKSLDSSQDWFVLPGENGGGTWSTDNHMHLNELDGSSGALHVQPAFPSSTAVKIGNDDLVNKANDEFIMYAWIRVPGFVGYGTYTGNSSSDGTYVVVNDGGSGFRPAWVMIKRIDGADEWVIFDSIRNPYNNAEKYLSASYADEERTNTAAKVDLFSNGFRPTVNHARVNTGTYLYLAFAEHPFGGDTVAQAKAR